MLSSVMPVLLGFIDLARSMIENCMAVISGRIS